MIIPEDHVRNQYFQCVNGNNLYKANNNNLYKAINNNLYKAINNNL